MNLDAPSESSSYDPEALGRSFRDEIERLAAQAQLSWRTEQRRLAALGVVDGQRVLEPGCGPGIITERLASWLPASAVVALDHDPRMLGLARDRLSRFGARVSLHQAAAATTGLPAHTFDVAISRYLFQHLPDPVAVAAEIRRVLRPGGFHVVIDIDDGLWGLCEPMMVEFAGWHRLRAKSQGARGGDRFRGRRLARILEAAGYARVELDVFAYHSDQVGVPAFAAQLAADQFLPLLEQGLLTLEDYLRAQILVQRFQRSPDAFVLSIGFVAYGEVPR